MRTVKIGIDVGGTHTKAVAIDNETHEIIGKSSVKTTHDHESGVADGVIRAFKNCMKDNNIQPDEVVFVAHSTTQATNALLEGDVAHVGIIGIGGGGLEGFLARRQTKIPDVDLGTGRLIKISNTYIKKKEFTDQKIKEELEKLKEEGSDVIVSSMAFGVDDSTYERKIHEIALEYDIPTTVASDITKLYGLTRRTRTAAINASILPKMLNTADSTEKSVKSSGVEVPLMIMRGDGGVMDIEEMKKRPVLTMLSGPAASVMGALMYLRASNGIYFEVGGTSTNIGVIKNGRPAIDYSIVGGHKTYISSLDVRVLGVAGGSMVRLNKSGVVDVGPRSAHIAGLEYAVFSEIKDREKPVLELFSPKKGDPEDYVAVRLKNGERVTITNSCAANVLGLVSEDHFSYGNVQGARELMQPLADYCNTTVEDISAQILKKSYEKIKPIILELIDKYKLDKEQCNLVGVGGGAASLLIYCAEEMGLRYHIPENAEVISSIGVALAMVRDVVERIIPNPTAEDLKKIRREALNKAVESGAVSDSVEIHIEIDSQTSKVTAIALGSTEVKATNLLLECTEEEAFKIAEEDFGTTATNCKLEIKNESFFVFSAEKAGKTGIRILDKRGFIKVQISSGQAQLLKVSDYKKAVKRMYEELAAYLADTVQRPDFYICVGARIMDFSGNLDLDQIFMLMDVEISLLSDDDEIIVVGMNNELH